MLYTVSIKNLNGLNKVGQNLIDFNQVSPISVSSPETPYDSFISDTRYNLDGFVQIPLYNRQQYCNIPPNSILTITTENSTEAIYYSTIKINGGSITVDPDPVSEKGGSEGSSEGGSEGGRTDEFAKLLLSRNFENNTLVIPDYITELGPGAINFGFNLNAVKLNPDNISVVSDIAFDFETQTISRINEFMNNNDKTCSYAVSIILDMSEGTSEEKMGSIEESSFSLAQLLYYDEKVVFIPLFIDTVSMPDEIISSTNPSSFFDINLSKKRMYNRYIQYFTIELDRDELPENILFINYNEQTGEIQNNILTPDLNYVKGESFVAPWILDEFPDYLVKYLEEGNFSDIYAGYGVTYIISENQLSWEAKQAKNSVASNAETILIYKTDIVKDGKNLFIIQPDILLNRKIETDQSTNLSLPLLTYKYQENRWRVLTKIGGEVVC